MLRPYIVRRKHDFSVYLVYYVDNSVIRSIIRAAVRPS